MNLFSHCNRFKCRITSEKIGNWWQSLSENQNKEERFLTLLLNHIRKIPKDNGVSRKLKIWANQSFRIIKTDFLKLFKFRKDLKKLPKITFDKAIAATTFSYSTGQTHWEILSARTWKENISDKSFPLLRFWANNNVREFLKRKKKRDKS